MLAWLYSIVYAAFVILIGVIIHESEHRGADCAYVNLTASSAPLKVTRLFDTRSMTVPGTCLGATQTRRRGDTQVAATIVVMVVIVAEIVAKVMVVLDP